MGGEAMAGYAAQRGDAAVTMSCAERTASAARTAARAERQRQGIQIGGCCRQRPLARLSHATA
jgi:hypothetical protein